MEFKTATDVLIAGLTLDDLADAMGVAPNTIRRARMDPSTEGSRTPPPGWEPAVAKLARRRSEELGRLADGLEEES